MGLDQRVEEIQKAVEKFRRIPVAEVEEKHDTNSGSYSINTDLKRIQEIIYGREWNEIHPNTRWIIAKLNPFPNGIETVLKPYLDKYIAYIVSKNADTSKKYYTGNAEEIAQEFLGREDVQAKIIQAANDEAKKARKGEGKALQREEIEELIERVQSYFSSLIQGYQNLPDIVQSVATVIGNFDGIPLEDSDTIAVLKSEIPEELLKMIITEDGTIHPINNQCFKTILYMYIRDEKLAEKILEGFLPASNEAETRQTTTEIIARKRANPFGEASKQAHLLIETEQEGTVDRAWQVYGRILGGIYAEGYQAASQIANGIVQPPREGEIYEETTTTEGSRFTLEGVRAAIRSFLDKLREKDDKKGPKPKDDDLMVL